MKQKLGRGSTELTQQEGKSATDKPSLMKFVLVLNEEILKANLETPI